MSEHTVLQSRLEAERPKKQPPVRLNLAQVSWLRPLLISRWVLFFLRTITFAGLVFTILAGLFGSQVGSHNFAIIFVWIAWWTTLKLVFIPLGGRSWCSVCPLPMPGEWLQRGRFVSRAPGRSRFGFRWFRRLNGYGIQGGFFLLIGLFSAVTLTDAHLTAWILVGLLILATAMSLLFERRAFCSNLCPIGGLTGTYAGIAPLELRVKDRSVCAAHTEKTCYIECPWGVYPLALKDNAACGLCLECLRVCPQDNIALNLRPFGSDLAAPDRLHRLDETFMALVMLGSALSFTVVFTGPWGWLRSAAFQIGSLPWFGYALGFLTLNLLVLPGIFSLAVRLGVDTKVNRKNSLSQAVARKTPLLTPLGLFAWIAFTISFALPKLNYVAAALSDPLGLGWHLLGEVPMLPNADSLGLAPPLQVAVLLLGLFITLRWILQHSSSVQNPGDGVSLKRRLTDLPLILFSLGYILVMLVLLVG